MRSISGLAHGCFSEALLALLMAAPPVHAQAAPKPEAAAPSLGPIRKEHCERMYGVVERRLKGRGTDIVSTATRNGLKDFFVTRPGVIDCTGQREIPWRDDKDREFILAVINTTNATFKPKADLAKAYGIGPAAAPVKSR